MTQSQSGLRSFVFRCEREDPQYVWATEKLRFARKDCVRVDVPKSAKNVRTHFAPTFRVWEPMDAASADQYNEYAWDEYERVQHRWHKCGYELVFHKRDGPNIVFTVESQRRE